MVMDVILNVQLTVKIAFVTYKPELVLHADQDGKGTLVKKVQLCNHVTQLIQLTVVIFYQSIMRSSVHLPTIFRQYVCSTVC